MLRFWIKNFIGRRIRPKNPVSAQALHSTWNRTCKGTGSDLKYHEITIGYQRLTGSVFIIDKRGHIKYSIGQRRVYAERVLLTLRE
jgi:peroxiredoxin